MIVQQLVKKPSTLACPLCHDEVGSDRIRTCAGCGTDYHGECLWELGGCSTLGCEGLGLPSPPAEGTALEPRHRRLPPPWREQREAMGWLYWPYALPLEAAQVLLELQIASELLRTFDWELGRVFVTWTSLLILILGTSLGAMVQPQQPLLGLWIGLGSCLAALLMLKRCDD